MATILARPTSVPERSATPPTHIIPASNQRIHPTPIPNKHLPYCSPGPNPASRNAQLDTPPASPPDFSPSPGPTHILYPPTNFEKLIDEPTVYGINANQLANALQHAASQPLPSPGQVFPWLHGLHPDNNLQLAFFIARKRSLRRTPACLRGLTVVKVGGDLTHSRVKGAIAESEILQPFRNQFAQKASDNGPQFLDIDPKEGFNVRNFQIQACKMATVSDIVVYGDNTATFADVADTARKIARAQATWQAQNDVNAGAGRLFNTFVLTDSYTTLEADHPDIISLDSEGCTTGKIMDFFHWERLEMCTMSAASEIAHNVWLGPTPEPGIDVEVDGMLYPAGRPEFDILIEASDVAQIPDPKAFEFLEDMLEKRDDDNTEHVMVHQLEFPGSGSILPPTWSQEEVDGLLRTCQWIYKQAHYGTAQQRQRRDSKLSLSPTIDADGDRLMTDAHGGSASGRSILIHCADGYTETSLLALAYYMYANCVTVHDAWLHLHREKGRNFFAYSSDVALLRAIQPRLMSLSPMHCGDISRLYPTVPDWLEKLDGSLPSRILPYMYLGNLGHANNPGLLKELGIGQILSVGEPVSWSTEITEQWPKEHLLFVDKVQDNGVDPLTSEFGRCLDFIAAGRARGTATLVHCRVGVSRSATICIAEVMREKNLSFPRAYCFVRARRLNVIIQPHLRFTYELLKWEETLCTIRGQPIRRELEWPTIAREIAAMNRPYSRQ